VASLLPHEDAPGRLPNIGDLRTTQERLGALREELALAVGIRAR
jgi:hypothetical protein